MKKVLSVLLSILFCLSVFVTPAFAAKSETQHFGENRQSNDLNDDYKVWVENCLNENGKYERIYVSYKESKIVYDVQTGEAFNLVTDKLLAKVENEEIVETNPFLYSSSSGFTIASRWVYSYTSQQLVVAYSPSVSDLVGLFIAFTRARGGESIGKALLDAAATQIIAYAITFYGSSDEVKYYRQTKHYANRYVLSDFANVYSSADQGGTEAGNIGYDLRITTNLG